MDVGKTPENPMLVGALAGKFGEETADAVQQQEIGQILTVGGITLATDTAKHKHQDSQGKQTLDPPNRELIGAGVAAVNAPIAR